MDSIGLDPLEDVMYAPTLPFRSGMLHAGTLEATYTLGLSETTRQWFAVGTVHSESGPHHRPAWIITGTGATPDLAVEDLRHALEHEHQRCTIPSAR